IQMDGRTIFCGFGMVLPALQKARPQIVLVFQQQVIVLIWAPRIFHLTMLLMILLMRRQVQFGLQKIRRVLALTAIKSCCATFLPPLDLIVTKFVWNLADTVIARSV